MLKFILFETSGVQLALEKQYIAHVQSADSLAIDVSSGPAQGEIHFQGRILPLIDLADVLDRVVPAKRPSNAKVLVTKGDPAVAVWADAVNGIIAVRENQLDQLPLVFNGPARTYFPYVLRRQGQLALVLDREALLIGHCEPTTAAQQSAPEETGEPARDNPAASVPTDAIGPADKAVNRFPAMNLQRLETIVIQKLQQLIAQRVQAVAAQTLAEALNRPKEEIKALLKTKRPATAAQ